MLHFDRILTLPVFYLSFKFAENLPSQIVTLHGGLSGLRAVTNYRKMHCCIRNPALTHTWASFDKY